MPALDAAGITVDALTVVAGQGVSTHLILLRRCPPGAHPHRHAARNQHMMAATAASADVAD